MFSMSRVSFILVVVTGLASCSSDSDNSDDDKHVVTISHSFNESMGSFSPNVLLGVLHDQALHDEHQVKLQTLPSPYEYRKGLNFKWPYSYPFEIDDISGSLGASLSAQISGLTPLTRYSVSFEMTILSNVPDVCPDSYGAIGNGINFYSSVYLQEPIVKSYYASVMNLSEFMAEGVILSVSPSSDTDRVLLGDLAIPILCQSYDPNNNWESKVLTGEKDGIYTADESGQGWLYFAVDSSYEAIFNTNTEFYITNLDVTFREL